MKQHKHHHFLILPQPQQRFKSLKASYSHFNKQPQLTKRQSLDSKPIMQMRKHPVLQNGEEIIFTSQGTKGFYNKNKPYLQINSKDKYYWKSKQGKKGKKKVKAASVKSVWSEIGKNIDQKNRSSYYSRSRYDQHCRVNFSDCFDTKNQFLKKVSNQSGQTSKSNHSKNEIKKAKSLLNSTMLTKRQSDEIKELKEEKYQNLIIKFKNILKKYQTKVIQLRQQRDYYRSKYRKAIKKQL